MNKTEALKRLDALDKEAKELRKIIEEPQTLMERIKTYSDVCKELNIEELTESDFIFLPKEQRAKMLAYHQIQNIAKLFNKGWEPNWSNSNEYKYYPWFEYKKSGGWLFYDVSYYRSVSFGEPAFYKNRETSEFCGKTFLSIYKVLLG